MRLQIVASPDVVHRRLTNPQALGQGAAAPLRSAPGFGLQGRVDELLDFLRAIGVFALPQTAVSDLAHLPGEPCPAAALDRLRYRANHPVPGPLRISGVGP